MAEGTNLSLTLECSDLIEKIDKSASKIDAFAQRAGKAFDTISSAQKMMTLNQQREFSNLKKTYDTHLSAIAAMVHRYEELRAKKQSNQNLTKSEHAELLKLSQEYKNHAGAIATTTKQFEALARSASVANKISNTGGNYIQTMSALYGNLFATAVMKASEAVADFANQIVSVGLETQQTVSQFAAMTNNLSDATATYQMFNDVARNTNYDFAAVNEMGKQLLNMGYSAKNAADLIQLCSDTAAGLGQGVSGAQQLVQVISRIQSTGEMSSKQLVNLQMAGIDTDKVFAKIGMSSDQAMQALKDGTLDSQKAISLLTDYMHEFDGSMNKSKENIADAWGDVTGNIATACGEIGADIANAFMKSEIVQDLIDFTQRFIELVRGDGSGAWSDFGQVAQAVLDMIAGLLKAVETAILVVVMAVDELWSGFKSMGKSVYDYLSWLLEPLGEIFTVVKNIVTALGKAVAADVNTAWTKRFKVPERNVDNNNHFKARTRASTPGGGGGSANKLSEEEKQIEALIKKYADASKQAQERGKIALQVAGLNASMLVGEAKQREELQNKIDGFTANHEALLKGYEKELELANKISDATVRKDTIDAINAQAKAQDELYNKQVEAAKWQAEFSKLQDNDKTLVDKFFGDPQSTQAKIDTIKTCLSDFMTEVNAMQASAGENGMSADSLNGLSEQSSGFLSLLNKTPEELAAEYETKQEQFANFADFIKSKMAEAAAEETKNLTIGEQWKQKQMEWITSIGQSMGSAVADWVLGSKKIGEAMAEMVRNLAAQAVQLLSQWTMVFALVSAFTNPRTGAAAANKIVLGIGDWNGQKLATGGFVSGPGTATSDSIPAMLSDGEYVLNASAVNAIGIGNLDAINFGNASHYAAGGAVGNGNSSGGIGRSLTLNISALDPASFSDFLGRGGLDSIKQALLDDDRQFGAGAGVW